MDVLVPLIVVAAALIVSSRTPRADTPPEIEQLLHEVRRQRPRTFEELVQEWIDNHPAPPYLPAPPTPLQEQIARDYAAMTGQERQTREWHPVSDMEGAGGNTRLQEALLAQARANHALSHTLERTTHHTRREPCNTLNPSSRH